MAEKCTPCVEKKIGELIANSDGRWTENDREFLSAFSEEQLERLKPVKVVETKEVQVNVLSDEDKNALAAYKAEQKAKRDVMISEIQANTSKEVWPDEVLNGMSDDILKRMHSSIKKENVVNYSLNSAGNFNTNASSAIEPLYPIGFEVK